MPLTVERALIDAGHDVVAIRTICPGANDRRVLETAVEQERVLITFDRDFGDLIFRSVTRPAPATVYVRARMSPQAYVSQMLNALEHVEPGYFLVVNARSIRKRPIA